MKSIYLYFLLFINVCSLAQIDVGPWSVSSLYEAPNWETTTVDEVSGLTSILYESESYLDNTVQVYAYYGVPEGDQPDGGCLLYTSDAADD